MTVKTNNYQIGLDAVAANNFVLQTPTVPDGTMKLARGIIGALIGDILAVDVNGRMFAGVPPVAGTRSAALASMQMFADEFTSLKSPNGWQKLASGVIIQWGGAVVSASSSLVVTLPMTFPGTILGGVTCGAGGMVPVAGQATISITSASQITLYNGTSGALTCNYIVIGY